MVKQEKYDVVIIGGGLAGLSAAIQLAKLSRNVLLVEKESYPHHKVCGEYISIESWDYLLLLGLDLENINPPKINRLLLSAPNGNSFTTKLEQGGFGMSRYFLDHALARIAESCGVKIFSSTKVDDVKFLNEFKIKLSGAHAAEILSKSCISAFGKRSNLDIKLNRKFLQSYDKKLQNFIGVKYHIHSDWPPDVIGLHNFKDGYCGISQIESGKYCLCYLTTAANLRSAGGEIKSMEVSILHKNPLLKEIFSAAVFEEGFPIAISQVSFVNKSGIEQHMLMTGDAAGMITPLCGNGMSMALHSGKIAAMLTEDFLAGKISREAMEKAYEVEWKAQFSRRMNAGRLLQRFFGSSSLSNGFVGLFQTFPALAAPVIRLTHGKPF